MGTVDPLQLLFPVHIDGVNNRAPQSCPTPRISIQ
jgi:hypothetical protein